jgi:hypothetical protein
MPADVSAYVPLANLTLGSSATSVTFSSINQTYRDLVLVIDNAREVANNGAVMKMRFNSNSTSIYNEVEMSGNGTTRSASTNTNQPDFNLSQGQGMSNTNPMNFLVNIMDYSTTNKHKNVLVRTNFPAGLVQASAKRFADTTAVSSITLLPFTGSIAANTTFALYGIAS